MRASTAYFAGAGTVIVAIAGGIGGGLLFADIVSPKTPKPEMTRLEQRMSAQPIEAKADAIGTRTKSGCAAAVHDRCGSGRTVSATAQTAAAPAAPARTPQAAGRYPGHQHRRRRLTTAGGSVPPLPQPQSEAPCVTAARARNRRPPRPKIPLPRPRTPTSSAPPPRNDAASAASNGPRSGATSGGRIRIRSCARSRRRCGNKPKPGRYLPPNRCAPRCRGSVCSIWIEVTIPASRLPA